MPGMRFPLAMLGFTGVFSDGVLHACRSGSGEVGKAQDVSSKGDPAAGFDSWGLAHSAGLYLLFTAR